MLVDQKNAIDELGLSQDEYREFVGDLLSYVNEVIPQMAEVVEGRGPREEIHSLAHTLKGACRNLRFVVAGDVAYALEQWGSGKSEADPKPNFSELKQVLKASFAEFGLNY